MILVDQRRAASLVSVLWMGALGVVFEPSTKAQAVAIAEVSGQVSDPSGSAIAGAQVKVTQTDKATVRATTTDAQGSYALPNLPVGPYMLDVSASGFKEYVQSGILLQVGDNVAINVRMQIGSISETVEVTASAGMVETRENAVSQVIDERRITNLPLNGRQATQLILLSGAAVSAPGGGMTGSKNYFSSTTISVAGGQANGTSYLLDGGDNNDTFSNVNLPFPFPDALQEFSVETSSLPARYGLHPGAVVNVVTKSGSNDWHGDLFEYLRNGDVNARNFFAAQHDSLKRNQFGGTIGGKILRDKLFFFAGYQGTRNRSNPPTTTSFVPTPAALSGDFSALESAACQSNGKAHTLTDPTTNKPFPNNYIPPSLFNAQAVKLVTGFIPAASNVCGKILYGIPTTGDEDQVIGRVDWVQNQKHSLFGRYFVADYRNPPVFDGKNMLTTTQAGNLERAQSVTLGDTYSFGPGTLNAFHATFTRRRDNRGPAPNVISPATLGLNIFSAAPNFLLVNVSNNFSVGCGTCAPGHFNVNTFQFADDIDLVRGRHQISFGVDFMRTQNNLISGFNENGTYTFNGQFTTSQLADFLLGRPSDFSQSNATPDGLRQSIVALYIQDTFHMSSRFTINAGLRWEPTIPVYDYYARGDSFTESGFLAGVKSRVHPNAPAGLLFYGDKGIPKSYWHGHLANFAPRLGLVWNPHGDGRDTLRVSGAILYDSTEVFFGERETTNPPYGGQIDIPSPAGGFTDPYVGYAGGNPFPPKAVTFPTAGVYVNMPLTLRPTYLAQWNVSYQRQFAGDWLGSVSYLGNKSSHLWVGSEIDPATYIAGTCKGKPCSTTSNTNKRRLLYREDPVQGALYSSIAQTDDGANSHYEAVLFSVQHRFSHDFTLLTNYTYSHCLSDADFTGELAGSSYEIPFNRRADYGNCNFDIRHVFNTSLVATSPAFAGEWTRRLLSNWQLAPIIRATSGSHFSVTSGKDNSLTGINKDRPNQILVDPYPASQGPHAWFNPAAFTANATGTFGNLGRDSLAGPGQLSFDLALSRMFVLREQMKLEARFEAFNVINHTNFNNPNTTLTSATFGQITTAGDPRILQFALKLHF